MNRRLYRCRHNQRIAGVAAGVAEFFDLDPTLVRLLFFLSIFVGGLGLLLYIGMAIIVPLEPVAAGVGAAAVAGEGSASGDGLPADVEGHHHAPRGDGPWTTFVGLALILFGSLSIRLPASSDLVGSLKVGAGELRICAPPGLGLRISSSGTSERLRVNGLQERVSDWQSPDYESASHRADLRVNATFGAVEINPIGECS